MSTAVTQSKAIKPTARKRPRAAIAPSHFLETLSIRFGPLKAKVTDDEFFAFCRANDELRIEMTAEGEMIIMMPTGPDSGRKNFLLTARFGAWVEADGTGVGFDSSTMFKLPNGAKRSPDAAWMRREKWDAIDPQERQKFALVCPDFVVELRSSTDRLKPLQKKMEEYIANGAQLGWLIDPIKHQVSIYRPDAEVEVLHAPQQLSGEPLLPGFTLNLKDILD